MRKAASIVHDLSCALLAGGIAAVGLAAGSVFGTAPTREIAGQIGNDLFARLGPAILVVSVLALAARVYLQGSEAASARRTASLALAIVVAAMAAAIALWLTPVMNGIWHNSHHAVDGSGLMGDERKRFMMLHGITNLLYMGIMIGSAVQLALGSLRRA